jgi:hypothetical protein
VSFVNRVMSQVVKPESGRGTLQIADALICCVERLATLAECVPDLMQRLSRLPTSHMSLFCVAESLARFPWVQIG